MKNFKADDLYLIRPMTLVKTHKYEKLQFLKNVLAFLGLNETPSENIKQTFLSLADDITIAESNTNLFTSVIDGKVYPKYSNSITNSTYDEITIVHPNYANKVSEILFQERSKKEGNYVSFEDFLNNGIYESLMQNLDKIAEEILEQKFDIDELKEILNQIKNKEKNKLITIENTFLYDYNNSAIQTVNKTKTKVIKIHEKVIRK